MTRPNNQEPPPDYSLLEGIVDEYITQSESATKNWLPLYLSSLNPVTKFKLSFSYVRSNEINAYVGIAPDGYEIVVYSALIHKLFREIFDACAHHLGARLLLYTRQELANTSMARAETIHNIADIALAYVTLHELAHIVLGHLDWLRKHEGLSQLSQTHPDHVPSPVTLQALEFWADLFAIGHASRHFPFALTSTTRGGGLRPGLLGSAMTILFNVLADTARPVTAYDTANHPSPSVRWACIVNLLSGLFVNWEFSPLNDPQSKEWRDGAFTAVIALGVADRLRIPVGVEMGDSPGSLSVALDPHVERFQPLLRRSMELSTQVLQYRLVRSVMWLPHD